MKALSLKQPYAELVVSGEKKIELRTWNTKFRGEFLVHASKQVDKTAMKMFGFNSLPSGCIVGKAVLTDVKHYSSDEEHIADKNKHLASSIWGEYGFVLEKAKRLVKPIPCKGALNFWEYKGKA
jgi:ASC-1-like (ASCH) protein